MGQILGALVATDFMEIPGDLEAFVGSLFSFVATKVIEDAFQRLRYLESRCQANRLVSPSRMWHTLVQRQLLDQLHQFKTVHYTDVGEKKAHHDLPRSPPQLHLPAWLKEDCPQLEGCDLL